jgi:TolA-binding protein
MKKLACVLAMSLMLWPACSTEQNKASQNENKGTESARQQRQMYQTQIEAKLRELDHEIDALTKKIENENSEDRTRARQQEYRAKAQQQMAELDRERAAARRQLDRLQNSGQDAWQDVKVGIDAAVQDLQAAYDRAASEFK